MRRVPKGLRSLEAGIVAKMPAKAGATEGEAGSGARQVIWGE